MAAGRLVLDVSNVNPITLEQARLAGCAALIAKETEGSSFEDGSAARHRQICRQLRIPFGGYLFLRVHSPGNEAMTFLRYARLRPGDMQPIIDAEDFSGGVAALARRAQSCARQLEQAGYRPILYCSAGVWPQLVTEVPALRRLRVWEAQYPGRFARWLPRLARLRIRLRRGASVVMWQWTDAYQVGSRRFDASRLFVPVSSLLIEERP